MTKEIFLAESDQLCAAQRWLFPDLQLRRQSVRSEGVCRNALPHESAFPHLAEFVENALMHHAFGSLLIQSGGASA